MVPRRQMFGESVVPRSRRGAPAPHLPLPLHTPSRVRKFFHIVWKLENTTTPEPSRLSVSCAAPRKMVAQSSSKIFFLLIFSPTRFGNRTHTTTEVWETENGTEMGQRMGLDKWDTL